MDFDPSQGVGIAGGLTIPILSADCLCVSMSNWGERQGLVLRQSAVHHVDPSMHLRSETKVMSDCDHRLAAKRHKVTKDTKHLGGRERIETAGRLVGENYRRVVRQRPCHGDALPLSARQLIGRLAKMIAQPERNQQFLRA